MGGRVQQWAPGQVGVVPYRSVEWFNPNSLPRPVSRFGKIRGKSSRAQRACDIYKSISGPGYISATAMRLGSGSLRCTAMKIIQRERTYVQWPVLSSYFKNIARVCKCMQIARIVSSKPILDQRSFKGRIALEVIKDNVGIGTSRWLRIQIRPKFISGTSYNIEEIK